ncbi:MAG: hypothetical protein U0168_32105 [Nannocystaceae bacterium]
MIDYAILCQSISDWRAGRRPTAIPQSSTPTLPRAAHETPVAPVHEEAAVSEEYDAVESVEVDTGYEEAMEAVAEEEVEQPELPTAPAEFDATMVYGAGGAMPGGGWDPAAPQPEATEPELEHDREPQQ